MAEPMNVRHENHIDIIMLCVSSGSRIWSRGGPSSGPPDLADVAERSWASKVSISRRGVWGLP